MSTKEKRTNDKIIVCKSSFFSLERINHYFNNILLQHLRSFDEINAKLGTNVEFVVNMLPVTLQDIIIPGKNDELPEKLPYLTDFINELADEFEKLLSEENKIDFRRRQRTYFISKLSTSLQKNKIKLRRTVGKTFIYCDNEIAFNILLNKDLNGNDNFVRKFNTKDDGILYTQEELDEFKADKEIEKLIEIDFSYKSYLLEDIANFFNFYSKDEYNDQRIELCNIISSFIVQIENVIVDYDTNIVLEEYEISNSLRKFKFDKNQLLNLLEIYRKNFVSRGSRHFFSENGLVYTSLVNKLKGKIILNFDSALAERLLDNDEGMFYITRDIFPEEYSSFMKALITSANKSFKDAPILPANVLFDFTTFKDLCSKILPGKKVDKDTPVLSNYNITKLKDNYKLKIQRLTEEIDSIFGSLENKPIIPIPGFHLNNLEKEWVSETKENIISKIDIAKINNNIEEVNSLELILDNMDLEREYNFIYEQYKVDSQSKVDGNLDYPISSIKIPIDNSFSQCGDLYLRGQSQTIINFFIPFFSVFAPSNRQPDLILYTKVNKLGKDILYLSVSYKSSDDCYDASKFRTIFTTVSKDKIKDDIKLYTVKWEQTAKQHEALSGINSKTTYKLYEEPDGRTAMKLKYPFLDESYKSIVKTVFDEQLEKYATFARLKNITSVGRNSNPRPNLRPDPNDFVPQRSNFVNEAANFYASFNRTTFGIGENNSSTDPSRRNNNSQSRDPPRRNNNFPSRRGNNSQPRDAPNVVSSRRDAPNVVSSRFLNNRYENLNEDDDEDIVIARPNMSIFIENIINEKKYIRPQNVDNEGYIKVLSKKENRRGTPNRRSNNIQNRKDDFPQNKTPDRKIDTVNLNNIAPVKRNNDLKFGPINGKSVSRGSLPKGKNNNSYQTDKELHNYPNTNSPYSTYSTRSQSPQGRTSTGTSSSSRQLQNLNLSEEVDLDELLNNTESEKINVVVKDNEEEISVNGLDSDDKEVEVVIDDSDSDEEEKKDDSDEEVEEKKDDSDSDDKEVEVVIDDSDSDDEEVEVVIDDSDDKEVEVVIDDSDSDEEEVEVVIDDSDSDEEEKKDDSDSEEF